MYNKQFWNVKKSCYPSKYQIVESTSNVLGKYTPKDDGKKRKCTQHIGKSDLSCANRNWEDNHLFTGLLTCLLFADQ